ncbi:hypothetical protein SAMN05216436_10226 [bacterium A37T11]|nr:hypothetical protein SAMN05216436_10226 [bacterium A37T11]
MTAKIFDRLFVLEFYKAYAGLFLFGGLLIVGICPPGQIISVNVTIAQALSSSLWAGAGACLAWAIYLSLVATFLYKKMAEVPYRFLQYSATAIAPYERLKIGLRVIVATGLPVYAYGLFCVVLGFRAGNFGMAILMLVFMVASILLLVSGVNRSLEPARQPLFQISFNGFRKLENNYMLLGFRQLIIGQKTSLVVSKILSYVLITGMFFIFSDLHDHLDMAALILVAVVLAHSSLLRGQFKFEQEDLAFMRNLPINPLKRLLSTLGRVALIFLPEMFWIIGRYGLFNALHLLFFMIGFALFIYHLSFIIGDDEEFFLKVLFFLFFAMVILIPFGISTYLGLLFFVSCGLIYRFS